MKPGDLECFHLYIFDIMPEWAYHETSDHISGLCQSCLVMTKGFEINCTFYTDVYSRKNISDFLCWQGPSGEFPKRVLMTVMRIPK